MSQGRTQDHTSHKRKRTNPYELKPAGAGSWDDDATVVALEEKLKTQSGRVLGMFVRTLARGAWEQASYNRLRETFVGWLKSHPIGDAELMRAIEMRLSGDSATFMHAASDDEVSMSISALLRIM